MLHALSFIFSIAFFCRDDTMLSLIRPNAFFRQILHLRIERTFIPFGNPCYFLQKFRFKTDAGLNLPARHDNTPLVF